MDPFETAVFGDIFYPLQKKNRKFNHHIKKRSPLFFRLSDSIKAKNFMPNSLKTSFNIVFPACRAFEIGCFHILAPEFYF